MTKIYGHGEGEITALDGVTADFMSGSFTAVMGPSGSGKSTLLQCAAGLDKPTSGAVTVAGTNLADLNDTDMTKLRRTEMGFIFQAFNLLPTLTVRRNAVLPLELASRRVDWAAVDTLLGELGLGDRLDHLPGQLSGGQQQRTAIARAVLSHPSVIFADEPTGALDSFAAQDVLRLLKRTVVEMKRTVVMVTHDPVAASYADSVVFLVNGRIADTLTDPTVTSVSARMTRFDAERVS